MKRWIVCERTQSNFVVFGLFSHFLSRFASIFDLLSLPLRRMCRGSLYTMTLVTCVGIFMSPGSLLAKTYYVQTGGSDSNDGTSPIDLGGGVGPWKTAIHGFESVPAGNVLAFGGGTYTIDRSAAITPIRSGSSSSPTIITNYNDEAVVFNPKLDLKRPFFRNDVVLDYIFKQDLQR